VCIKPRASDWRSPVGKEFGRTFLRKAIVGNRTLALAIPIGLAMFRNRLDHSGFYADRSGGIYGGVMWCKQTQGAVRSSPTVAQDVVFAGSCDGNLYALDVNTGNERWKFSTGSAVLSSATVSEGRVFFSSYQGTSTPSTWMTGNSCGRRSSMLIFRVIMTAKLGNARLLTMAISSCLPRPYSRIRL
jgi:outer membrane protein assembly factor BamB